MKNGADLAGRRILIVEDEFLLAMELELLLPAARLSGARAGLVR